jgi:adenylyltransferase/sulfurtransferase
VSARYSRQELFAGIGPAGQERLRRSRVLVVGCGALGSCLAEIMTRAGVGALTVVDRDFVEESNLQRQSLFDEADAAKSLPKAVAAEARLRAINAEVALRGVVADVSAENASRLVGEADLVLDGTDNLETRYLLNDVCLERGVPWVYGACVASYGLTLLVRPGTTPCLRCVLGDKPGPGSAPTCDTAGIVSPVVHVVAGVQAAEALKLLAGDAASLLGGLVRVDLWSGVFETTDLRGMAPSCPACREGRYDYAQARPAESVLCGRDAVQVRPAGASRLDLRSLAARLAGAGEVQANEHLVRFHGPEADLVVFADGRAIVKGVADLPRARSLYSRYVGS